MFTNQKPLIFGEAKLISGVSSKNNKPYEFANVILSDGFKAVELPLKRDIYDSTAQIFKHGDKVNVTIDVETYNGKPNFVVALIEKSAVQKVS